MTTPPTPAAPRVALIGCKSHGPAWDANTHHIIVVREDADAFHGYPLDNREPWERKDRPVGLLQYPRFAWEVRS